MDGRRQLPAAILGVFSLYNIIGANNDINTWLPDVIGYALSLSASPWLSGRSCHLRW